MVRSITPDPDGNGDLKGIHVLRAKAPGNAGPGAACMNGASASRVTSKPVVYEMWIRRTGHVGGRHEGHPTAIYQRLDWLLRPVTTGDSVIIPLIK